MKAAAASTINGAAMDVERAIFVAVFICSQLRSAFWALRRLRWIETGDLLVNKHTNGQLPHVQ